MIRSIKYNVDLEPKMREQLKRAFNSGQRMLYTDTDSCIKSHDTALCMYDYADILLKEEH